MNDTLKTTLWFYTGADYLTINSFLWRNKIAVDECLEIVWNNNRAIIQEADEQTPEKRFYACGVNAIHLYESYRARTPEIFTDEAKDRMIDLVIEDVRCICQAMRDAPKELMLIRHVDERYAIKKLNIGDTIELLGLTSTSTTGQLIDYGQENYRKPGQIFYIHVDKKLPYLQLENSRENEVLLPPMAYKVLDRRMENGIDVLVLKALFPLDVESIICQAKSAWIQGENQMTAPFNVTGIRLETERLILRPWQETDLADFYAYTSDEAVAPGMGWKRMETLDEAKKLFQDYMADKESFALELKDSGRVIGDISVQTRPWEMYPIDRTLKGRELGFGIRSAWWGRGLMPEAVRAVIDYCFDTLNFDFITCGHFTGNDKSKRVIEKCGFTYLFEADHTIPKTGVTHHCCSYILYNPHKER